VSLSLHQLAASPKAIFLVENSRIKWVDAPSSFPRLMLRSSSADLGRNSTDSTRCL
jgi:hypothetical protein